MSLNLSNKKVSLLLYTLAALLIRLPFFFRDSIDRDESTFILMGQSWVDGYLPYTQLWDLKPPLVFLFFAVIIQFFGKSYIAIRLFGALVIVFTAFFVNLIARKGTTAIQGFYAGLLYVYLSSLFGSIQGVMSEHLALFFFMLGFLQLLESRTNARLFFSALLFGASLMFRLNLAYPVAFLFIYYLLFSGFTVKEIALKGLLSVAGGVAVPLMTFLPYLEFGIPEVWWNAVILASLSYDQAGINDILEALLHLSPFLAIFFIGIVWKKRFVLFRQNSRKFEMVSVACAGILFMLAKSGKVNTHYLIQLYPFILLLLLPMLYQLRHLPVKKAKPYLFSLFLLLPVEAYMEYGVVGARYLRGEPLFNGYGITIPNYIEEHYPEQVKVLFLDYHIGYWELDKLPPSKIVTHPSNLLRKSNYAFVDNIRSGPLEELQFILEEFEPDLIVSRSEHISFAKKKSQENQFFEAYMDTNYTLVYQEKRAFVFERKK